MNKIFMSAFFLFVVLFSIPACNKADPSEPQAKTATLTATITATVSGTATFTPTSISTKEISVIIFQNGVYPSAAYTCDDTYLTNGLDSTMNFSFENSLNAGYITTTPAAFRSLLKFYIAAVIPAGSTIISAVLSVNVYRYVTGSGPVIKAFKCTQTWVPSQVSWDNKASGVPWTAGAIGSAISDAKTIPQDFIWNTIPIYATEVQGWLNSPSMNNGFFLIESPEQSSVNTQIAFYSADYISNPTYRPKLTVYYYAP